MFGDARESMAAYRMNRINVFRMFLVLQLLVAIFENACVNALEII